jgi:hypothetical protein
VEGYGMSYDKVKYQAEYREKNKERLNNYDKIRNSTDERKLKKSLNHKKYYALNREKVIERTREYKKTHPELKIFIGAWRKELNQIWGVGQKVASQEVGFKAEAIIAALLPSEGYQDVYYVADDKHYANFPIDVFAKKDGFIHAFQVTTYPKRKITSRLRDLVSYMGWILHITFVRPNLRDYYDIVVSSDRKNVAVPIDIVMKEGRLIPNELQLTI